MQRWIFTILVVAALPTCVWAGEKAAKSKQADAAKALAGKKDSPMPAWVPRYFHGNPVGSRLVEIQTELEQAHSQLGPLREAAHKAQQAAHVAQQKSDNALRKVKWLESEKLRLLTHGAKQQRDTTLDKRDFESEQKIKRLEALVRDLTIRLDAAVKQAAPARPAPVKEKASAKT